MARAARARRSRTRSGSRSSSASSRTGAATPDSSRPAAVVVVNGRRRRVRQASSTSCPSTTAASSGRVTRRRTETASTVARSCGGRSSRITANSSSTTSAGAPDPSGRPGRRASASAATTTASGCPRAKVRIRCASSPRTPWAASSRSTSGSVMGPTTSSASRVRQPGAVRQATFGPRRPTSRTVTDAGSAPASSFLIHPSSRLRRSKLSITRTSVPASAIAPAADGRRRRWRHAEGGAERGQGSRHGRFHLASVEHDALQRQGGQRAGDQRGLADPAGAVHEDGGGPVRAQQRGQPRSLLRATDEGGGRRLRQTLRYGTPGPGHVHARMLEPRAPDSECPSRTFGRGPVRRSCSGRSFS